MITRAFNFGLYGQFVMSHPKVEVGLLRFPVRGQAFKKKLYGLFCLTNYFFLSLFFFLCFCEKLARKYCEMLHEERCLGLIIDIIDEKLKSYHFHDRRHRQFMRARLMEVVSDNCYDNSRCFKCESKEPNIANVLRNEAADDLSNDDQQFLKECNTTSKMKQSTDDKQFLKECNTTSIMKQSTDESIDSIYRCMENSFNIDGKIEVSRSCPKPNFDHLIISKEDLKLFRQLNDKNRISLISCDCSLRVYLCEDPFLCLPSLILKTFQRHCPRLLPTELSF